jgi:glutathione S-transferase
MKIGPDGHYRVLLYGVWIIVPNSSVVTELPTAASKSDASSWRLGHKRAMPEFLAKNSSGAVPVLELDDGSYLSESVAICRYLEGLQPEPNLLGRDLREQAEVERWNRRMELELFAPIGRTFQNTNPIFQRRIKQFPEYGEAQRAIVYQRLERMDHELDGQEFIASDRFTIADITALVAIDFGLRLADIQIAPSLTRLTRWHETVSKRASAKA